MNVAKADAPLPGLCLQLGRFLAKDAAFRKELDDYVAARVADETKNRAQLVFLFRTSNRLNNLLVPVTSVCREKADPESVAPGDIKELRKRLLKAARYYVSMSRELEGDDLDRLLEIFRKEKALSETEIKFVTQDSGVPHEPLR